MSHRIFFDTEFLEDGNTILPISIGMVRDDGEEYYAEFAMSHADWNRVMSHEWLATNVAPYLTGERHGASIIAADILDFVGPGEPEFWAYCAAYDWVLLNQVYGPMVDHPGNWPFYCNDIAQEGRSIGVNRRAFSVEVAHDGDLHNALDDARWTRDVFYWLQLRKADILGERIA